MATQTRWLCHTCGREWIESTNACGALPWSASLGCPGCRSAQIEQRIYTPTFPGADIPRDSAVPVIPTVMEPTTVVQAPPRVLTADAEEGDALAAQWEALCGGAGAIV